MHRKRGLLYKPTLDEDKAKKFLAEVLVEMIQQKREIFYDLILKALEEVSLANAIQAGEETELVNESEIRAILQGEA
ncbi:MAG: hypothetical protein AAFQ89_19925 [Cyanobacteria bacterium J06626_18]